MNFFETDDDVAQLQAGNRLNQDRLKTLLLKQELKQELEARLKMLLLKQELEASVTEPNEQARIDDNTPR